MRGENGVGRGYRVGGGSSGGGMVRGENGVIRGYRVGGCMIGGGW